MTVACGDQAQRAWNEQLGLGGRATAIEVLKSERRKSTVYRIRGLLPGAPVVAKRCSQAVARVERDVYESIMPQLPLPRLRLYGCAAEADEACWLFVEDAGDDGFNPAVGKHRELAARWLGVAHTVTATASGGHSLPDRDASHYRALLDSALGTLGFAVHNPALETSEIDVLKRAIRQCERLASNWGDVSALLQALPRTFVHGGFYRKNIRIKTVGGATALLPFDWESAGWGFPAIDLAHVDPRLYLEAVKSEWPNVDLAMLEAQVRVGRILWCLKAVPGEGRAFRSSWPKRAVAKVGIYSEEMAWATARLEDSRVAVRDPL
jgi:Phosphotransferase enzyme family